MLAPSWAGCSELGALGWFGSPRPFTMLPASWAGCYGLAWGRPARLPWVMAAGVGGAGLC